MKAKWQKATFNRQVFVNPTLDWGNKEIWVRIDNPRIHLTMRGPDGTVFQELVRLETNLLLREEHLPLVSAPTEKDGMNFLDRGPEDFAEDVEMVPYEVWSSPDWEGCKSNKQEAA